MRQNHDVVVIGAGPAGLAAAIAASDSGAKVLLIEREARAGGVLKQCIHDGFGLVLFQEKLTGPEYAQRFIRMVKDRGITVLTSTFVTSLRKEDVFQLVLVNRQSGVFEVEARAVILSTGCRERSPKQVSIMGTRPAGILAAGTAQYFVNMLGYLPCRRCVILGSGDIGLIMARRLVLEGAQVLGVFEAKPEPSGLARNVAQCLEDFHIPMMLSHTVTRVFGEQRVTAVEISKVDDRMRPVPGSEWVLECDGVILSVGLIPENELAEGLGVILDPDTRGPVVDRRFMTSVPGVFSCGNALHVYDLVDHVTESGFAAGRAAAAYCQLSETEVCEDREVTYGVPQRESRGGDPGNVRRITCIICPKGCTLEVESGPEPMVTGYQCKRGRDYGLSELTVPHRSITTTVRTCFGNVPRLPVRTDKDLEMDKLLKVVRALDGITLDHPVHIGDVIVENILDTGSNIIATSDLYELIDEPSISSLSQKEIYYVGKS